MQIRLGIGDILIFRASTTEEPLIEINKSIIREYRNDSNDYFIFIEKLIKHLFKNVSIIDEPAYIDYNIDNVNNDISKYFEFEKNDENYICLHTKLRVDDEIEEFNKNKNQFCEIINDLPFEKVYIVGERIISENFETKYHSHSTIYPAINNKKYIDKTVHTLNNNPLWEQFIKDLSLIKNANMNIGIGLGGNMVMSTLLNKNNAFYTLNIKHQYLSFFNDTFFNNLNNFKNKIWKHPEL